uniref:Uncharacterized protein n=1 Tax=Glycine max TaxID=3847 RepID=C6T4J3_SOYBN|nr:unknown [Glycine max]
MEERFGVVLAAESNDRERDPQRHTVFLVLLRAKMEPTD